MTALAAAIPYPHVTFDESGVPYLASTTMKVVELVMAQQAHGWSPEELHFQHPYLPIGHIYSALAYYWDHKEELDDEIERRDRLVEVVRRELGDSALAERLRARGRLA